MNLLFLIIFKSVQLATPSFKIYITASTEKEISMEKNYIITNQCLNAPIQHILQSAVIA